MNRELTNFQNFDSHRMISFIFDPIFKLKGVIAIHRNKNFLPSFGATRFASYKNLSEAAEDALRLSKLMSYKSALAGLKYGGAKGVIIAPPQPYKKSSILAAYCNFVNYLQGQFITGADAGINNQEVKQMRKKSKFIVGVKVDPVKYTVLGLLGALEVCLKEIYGNKNIEGRDFAIQGLGKTGNNLTKILYKQAKRIFVTDINPNRLRSIKKTCPKVIVVPSMAIYQQKVDVFMPCALGKVLSTKTIPKIRASIILGAANNQLENSASGEMLYKLGILYAPDYVVNAGGLIAVTDEYENKNTNEPRIKTKLNHIKIVLNSILKQSQIKHTATNIIADRMAEDLINKTY